MTTASAIIKRAFRFAGLIGTRRVLNGDYLAEGFDELRLLVEELRLTPTIEFTKTTTPYVLAGQASVTVGPGGDINIPRPVRIERETYAMVGSISYPVQVIDRARFNSIELKDTGTAWPEVLSYEAGSPLGTLRFWPKSSATLYLVTTPAVALFEALDTAYSLSDGYEGMLGGLLAERVGVLYEKPLGADALKLVRTAKRLVMRNNLQVPQLHVRAPIRTPEAAFISGE